MAHLSKAILLVAGLGLAACTNPGRFDNMGARGGAGADAGSASDPTSVAYFNETVGDRVFFAVDESTLSLEAQETLRKQAAWMAANPEYAAIIEGHADEQGTREYNLALGARRASAVQNYLMSQGVEPGRLRTVSYGKERPIEVCSEESCYSRNRRAVSVISAGGTS